MARKDITDKQVCEAVRDCKSTNHREFWPYELLAQRTGECEKVCYAAMERAYDRDYIEYGVSLRSGWLTEEGRRLIA